MLGPGRLPVLLALSLSICATGCGKIREIRACRELTREVNPVLDKIEALSSSKAADKELQMAREYHALAKRLAPRTLGASTLAGAVRDYTAILSAADTALRAQAEALKSNNLPRVTETRRELERLVKRERTAVTRLTTECRI